MIAFHITALAIGTFLAAIWSRKGGVNILCKIAMVAFAAWAAVIVAGDWVATDWLAGDWFA